MTTSWITLYPNWYIRERELLARHYPDFRVDERRLLDDVLTAYGELVVRPPGGAVRHPIRIHYPEATPYAHLSVTPIESLPKWKDGGIANEPEVKWFDRRHQMHGGQLCLFQRETRVAGGDVVDIVQVLRRTERWFRGHHTGNWPPDTAQSELETHFEYATDVLIEDAFYDPALSGSGRLVVTYDFRRAWEAQNQDQRIRKYSIIPMILTSLTEEKEGVVRVHDARRALSRLYLWIDDKAWDPQQVAASPDPAEETLTRTDCGYWWSLPSEPHPFRDGGGLLEVLSAATPDGDGWAMVRAQLGADLTMAKKHILGMRFPSRQGGVEWLIICVLREPKKDGDGYHILSDEQKRAAFTTSRVLVIRGQRTQPSVLRLRNQGVVRDSVAGKTVALIGLGALGSSVAELLAKAGVGRFRLCDSDRLSTGNVARHVGAVTDFGAAKTQVVMQRLLEINPYLEFGDSDVITGSAITSLGALAGLMDPADLTICTTADESVESVVNQVALIHRSSVLYGRSLRRASMGRVFLVRPGRDACKACLAEYLFAGREGKPTPPDWVDIPEDEGDELLHECGRPVIAASAVDLSFISGLISRAALYVLEGRDADTNHWIWSQAPAPELDPRLSAAMATLQGRLPQHPDCRACREPDVVSITIADEVRDAIITMAEGSLRVETGGVLIGHVDECRRAVVLRATGPGPKAVRSAAGFRRDVEHIQVEVDLASAELGPRGTYLGEWHTHLNPEPTPSAVDVESLSGIAKVPSYLTRCPVLLIAGIDPGSGKVARLRSWAFPLGGRAYSIESEAVGEGYQAIR